MSILSDNLKRLRINNKKTQEQMAKIINKKQQTYGKYEKCITEPDTDTLKILANYFNVTVDSLLGKNINENETTPKGFKIPVLGTIPAGIPIEAIEEILDYEEIPQEWATRAEYFGLKVRGTSMEPRILNRDVVIVEKVSDAENGSICVVMVNGNDATLKQIKKDADGIWLIPFNKTYSPMFYSNEQIVSLPVKIIGKVVELRGKF